MKKKIIILTFACCLIFTAAHTATAESENGYIKKGNALYREENWDDSLQAYLEGALKYKGSDKLNFNSGDAFYKKEDFEKAKEQFQKTLFSKNNAIKTKASYNTGNALFKEAQKSEKSNAQQAQELLKQAQAHYKQAINLNPKDSDAKYNYEIATKYLEKIKQQCQLPKQQNNQQNKDKSDKNQQQQQQQQQEQQSQEQNKENQKSEEEKEKQKEQQKTGSSEKKENEMSKEEAQMLIDNYGQEGLRLELRDKHEPAEEKQVEKDW